MNLETGNGEDAERRVIVRSELEVDDSTVRVEGNRLRAALGHPVPPGIDAADQLEAADASFYKDKALVSVKWKAAMAANELAGAKAANAMERDALQRYIEKLRTIPIPAGFEEQVNAMREILTGFVESDRRQVDVATVADIVPAPEEGAPNLVSSRMKWMRCGWPGEIRTFRFALQVLGLDGSTADDGSVS